jgi:hypothetical protein
MNKERQRIAIAEACGWKLVEDNPDYEPYWEDPKGNMIAKVGSKNRLPDYLNDLNAMHEAEEKLPLKKQMLYQGMIGKVTGNKCPALFGQIHATAAQRAEAFLRTISKWEETKL